LNLAGSMSSGAKTMK